MSDDCKDLAARLADGIALISTEHFIKWLSDIEALYRRAMRHVTAIARVYRRAHDSYRYRRHTAYLRKRRRGQSWRKVPYRFR